MDKSEWLQGPVLEKKQKQSEILSHKEGEEKLSLNKEKTPVEGFVEQVIDFKTRDDKKSI